jgi:hypothetical protein
MLDVQPSLQDLIIPTVPVCILTVPLFIPLYVLYRIKVMFTSLQQAD